MSFPDYQEDMDTGMLLMERPAIPANLASPCNDPAILEDRTVAGATTALVQNTVSLVDCKKRHATLVEVLNGV